MENELKSCPFCGADPLMQEFPAHKHAIANWPDHPGSVTVECLSCGVGLIADTKANAASNWNNRVLQPEAAKKSVPLIAYKQLTFAEARDHLARVATYKLHATDDCGLYAPKLTPKGA